MRLSVLIVAMLVGSGWVALDARAALDGFMTAAEDSLAPAIEADETDEARQVLETLRWPAEAFTVSVTPADGQDFESWVAFASPKPSGDAQIDRVTLRWYRPESRAASVSEAVLVVHTLHPDMPVATMLCRGLRQRGIHAFLLELPGYGSRVGTTPRMTGVTTLLHAAQAVADCRRAADAIKALSAIQREGFPAPPERVALQGTSLGSFIAAAAGSLDHRFSKTFLFLSGGDGADILERGQKDAFHVRRALRSYGYDDAVSLRKLISPIEPLTIAHRLDPATTWMFNARDDTVVPAENANRLAAEIGLAPEHHVWMPGQHYTSFLLLPGVLEKIAGELTAEGGRDGD